jgi:threonine/homoserine/homoserine lactone efflux protein
LDANVIALGLLVAMSPLPVLAEVLSMTESGRVRPAVALALGYALALGVIAVAAVVVGSQASSGSTASKTTAIVDLVAGVLLLLGALRTRRRSRNDPDAGLPKWISRVGSMSTVFAFALGAFLPPYVVALAAGNEIVREGLSSGMAWAQALVFVVVACIGVVTPIVIVVASPSGAEARLATWKAWLERHWQTVVAVILLVAGIYLVLKGAWELHQAS